MRKLHISTLVCFLIISCQLSLAASFDVPAGTTWYVNGSSLAANTYNLNIYGTLVITSGNVSAHNVTIFSGGVINAGSGLIQVSGHWNNNGTFNAGTSHVEFIDDSMSFANIFGSTTFYDLTFISSIGKSYRFSPDERMLVNHNLLVQGASGKPIVLESTIPNQLVSISVGGTSTVENADLEAVTIQQGPPTSIPTLQPSAMLLLALLLIWSTIFYYHRIENKY